MLRVVDDAIRFVVSKTASMEKAHSDKSVDVSEEKYSHEKQKLIATTNSIFQQYGIKQLGIGSPKQYDENDDMAGGNIVALQKNNLQSEDVSNDDNNDGSTNTYYNYLLTKNIFPE